MRTWKLRGRVQGGLRVELNCSAGSNAKLCFVGSSCLCGYNLEFVAKVAGNRACKARFGHTAN
jgi:hypothetical protein